MDIIEANIQNFLSERGLTINKEKSKVVKFDKDNSFDFLGFTFAFFKKGKLSSITNRRDISGIEKLWVYPSRNKVFEFRRRIKLVIKSSLNLTAFELIKKLNPILRG